MRLVTSRLGIFPTQRRKWCRLYKTTNAFACIVYEIPYTNISVYTTCGDELLESRAAKSDELCCGARPSLTTLNLIPQNSQSGQQLMSPKK